MALTDISGIGSATADQLREDGITSKQQLLKAFREGDSRVVGGPFDDGLNARAIDGIRQELTGSGESFVDPIFNIPATKDNEQAREMFDKRLGSDVAEGFGSFTRDRPDVDAGMNVLEAAGEATQGNLGPMLRPESYEEITPDTSFSTKNYLSEADEEDRARKEAYEWGLDAAANVTPFERQTIESGNELSQQTAQMGSFTVQQTTTTEREVEDGTIEAEDNMQIDAREYARAKNFQRQRSPKARRVDNRQKAPVTDEITTWKEDPSHWDYPTIDTPGGKQDIVVEDRREQAANIDETVESADEEVTDIAFGNPLDEMF